MSPLLYFLTLALIILQFAVPLRWAFIPLLIAVCHFQSVHIFELGASFTPIKLVIVAGLLRAIRDRAFAWSSRNSLDLLIAIWACWTILSGFAHHPKDYNPITIRLSWVFDIGGAYLYIRAFVRDREDYLRLLKSLALVLIPLAMLVLYEKITAYNLYGSLTGFMDEAAVRHGRVRTAGPFSHPILLGTFAASALVLVVPLLRGNLRFAIAGITACIAIVTCSGSSGPILTLIVGLAALGLWYLRSHLTFIRVSAVLTLIILHMLMNDPVWYLMARVDLAGGSTGYHRARLITAAIEHLDTWWLIGTDYTRDWIPYGVQWTSDEVDITNYYLRMGVNGGLTLMFLFIAVLVTAFNLLGREMQALRAVASHFEFTLWASGAALFAHCVTFLSVTYFDQTCVAYCLILGAVPALCVQVQEPARADTLEADCDPVPQYSGRVQLPF